MTEPRKEQITTEAFKQLQSDAKEWRDFITGRKAVLTCEDCSLPYRSFPLDMTLPDDQWAMIHPGDDGGVLCAQCIVQRASRLGRHVIAVRAVIEFAESGP